MSQSITIQDREVGAGHPCFIIAEVSCNHEGDYNEAKLIIEAAAKAGANAVKLQTYTADTISRDFKTKPEDTMWSEIDLHALYVKAHTPWDWHDKLKAVAEGLGIILFSSPFDETAVDFLVEAECPVLKLASFELVDTKLIEKMAKTGLPIIMSNGMSTLDEMQEAVDTLRKHGNKELAILQCNSGYPTSFDEVNMENIPALAEMFNVPIGVSDHTIFTDDNIEDCTEAMAHVTPVEAVRNYGASIVEIHLTLDRDKAREMKRTNDGGFDWPFSMNPDELKKMVDMIRTYEREGSVEFETEIERKTALRTHAEKADFDPTPKEISSRTLRPTLWVVKDMKAGEAFEFAAEKSNKETGNFDSVRPGDGMHIRFTDLVVGAKAAKDIPMGTPLTADLVDTNLPEGA